MLNQTQNFQSATLFISEQRKGQLDFNILAKTVVKNDYKIHYHAT